MPIPKTPYFYSKYIFMKWLKLTAFTFLITSMALISCKQEDNLVLNEYAGNFLPMSGGQEVPAVATSAIGQIQANYSQFTKTLTYKILWAGLSGNATAAHIHGTGETGVAAGVLQTFVGFPLIASGSYSGSLYIDGVKFREENLLAGRYYINIHTATNPGGEIRGQIKLSKL